MSYFDNLEYASKNLIAIIIEEHETLKKKQDELQTLESKRHFYMQDFLTSDLEDFPYGHSERAFSQAAKSHESISILRPQIELLEQSLESHEQAIQALCGAVLQIVKQGISIVHGGIEKAPNGRYIANQKLKDIVWIARNQSIHFEEKDYRKPTKTLFSDLEKYYGELFSLKIHRKKNRAKEVFNLLGWNQFEIFEKDNRDLGL